MKKLFYIVLPIAIAARAQASYTNATLNISTCGSVMSGGGYTSIGSCCPLGQMSQAGSLCNYSGFAAGFILQPNAAFSGLSDEWNPDNDRDGLQDDDEIVAGSSLYNSDTDNDGLSDPDEIRTHRTSPILADSDTDGMNDARELIAGTSPTNRSNVLSVSCTLSPNGQKQLSWFGVQGRVYTFQYCDSLDTDNWQSYPSEIAGTGAPVSVTDTTIASNRFYRVTVRAAE